MTMKTLKPSYSISHSLGMKTYRPRIKTPHWDKVLNIHCTSKVDALHHAKQEIELLESISRNPGGAF